MKNLVNVPIVLILAAILGCTHLRLDPDCPEAVYLDAPPEIDQVLPADEQSTCLTMTSSASLDPAYTVEAGGLTFTAATGYSDRTIIFVAVSDPAFRTPEGYRVGTQLQTIIRETGSELKQESGWACFVTLPSGWNAALPLTEGSLEQGVLVDCSDQSALSQEIGWFFKRR